MALHYLRRDQALICIVALCFGNALNSILKTFWHEPRPYLLSEQIVPAKCSNWEYGMPSGHTMGYILVYRTVTKMFKTDKQWLIQTVLMTSVFFVSYNRAQ